ncbi:DUF2254 domain-containing protein [uncultured Williamsia sp.]|uniref:DUF2254 domain-containing protein n=1 Tax=uncultured Williamsia sp. TaxID=259311 RepID=UPI002636E7C5|nr:DUF2254 domain-containing protein [uncultured Williamsia sp.]
MRSRLARLAELFWLVPTVLGVTALVLAQSLISVDRALDDADFGVWGRLLYRVGASGSRDILGAIGGSMLAVAATSFSITVSVLATASSTYGPRLVRNFMNDRGNQFVLGMFGATFLYALMVLRSIRSETITEGQFVPDIAVNVAVLLAVVDVLVLVYFINHIAGSIQVSTLSARVRSELVDVVDALYPETQPDNARPAHDSTPALPANIHSATSGFVIDVDEVSLLRTAATNGCRIEVRVRPGDHVVAGEPIARVHPTEKIADVADDICSAVHLGDTRTPLHDIQFAVQQLVEMAVRALSPSTNDPFTARNALDELATGMVRLADRPTPLLGRVCQDDVLRLVVVRVPVDELIDDIFESVRIYALDAPIAMSGAVTLARRIGVTAAASQHDGDHVVDAVRRHLDLLDHALDIDGHDHPSTVRIRDEIAAARTAMSPV